MVRFLDADGKDIIPRKDRVWTLDALATRCKEALSKAKAPVPAVLDGLIYEGANAELEEVAFSMFCFWTGEMKLGGIDGVVNTEAGFFDGREVTRVWYDPAALSLQKLVNEANRIDCANRVYFVEAKQQKTIQSGKLTTGVFKASGYRPAPAKDQKKQLQGTKWADRALTAYQRTKLNAFGRKDQKKAERYASPGGR